MPTLVTDPDLIRRVREAAGQRQGAQPAQSAPPPSGRVVTDPGVIQAVKNRVRLQDAAKKRALEVGQDMPEAPDRISQAFDVAAQGPEAVGGWHSALQGAGDSAALGFGDEIGAAMDLPVSSLFSGNVGKAYDINLARRRQLLEQARTQQPGATLAGEVGGALLAPGLGVGVAAKGAGLGTRLLYGMGQGATQGAAYGAGSGEGIQDRAVGGLIGAGVGAGAGLAAPLLTEGVVQAGRGAKYFNPLRGSISREGQAAQQVSRNLARDAGGAQNVPSRLQELRRMQQQGIPAVVGDIGGESTHAIARAAANISPEAKAALENATGPRFKTQNDRATTFIRSIVGNTDLPLRQEQLKAAGKAVNQPAYNRAFAQPAAQNVWDNELEILAGDPLVQTAIRQASITGRHEAAMAGAGPLRNPFKINPQTGGMTLDPNVKPTLRFWNQVKINLDKVGTRESTASARVLREHLDSIVPEYATARAGAHQFFKADNALDAGKNFVTMELNNGAARSAIAKMSAPERDLFMEGFASQLIERIGNAKDRSSVLEQAFITSPNARQRIQIALGPQRAQKLEAYLRIEGVLDKFKQAISGGPSTARQLMQAGLPGAAGGSLAFVSPYSPTQGSVSPSAAIALGVMGMRYGINRSIAKRIGEMLASDDPKRFLKGLNTVSKNQKLMGWIRSLGDKRVAKAGAQQGTQAAEPLKVYLNAGERDRTIGR